MMKKLMFLGAGAAGYVLGAKAGRERYDQIAEQARKLRNNPMVQERVDQAKHVAKDATGTAVDKAKEKVGSGSSDTGSTGTSAAGMSSTPTGTTPPGFGVGSEGG